MDKELKDTLLEFSTKLHELEAKGLELPPWLERFWFRITVELEKK